MNSRVLLSLQWVDRKSPDTLSSSPKQHSKNSNYMGLREKVSDSQDFLIAGFENIIQVYSIQYTHFHMNKHIDLLLHKLYIRYLVVINI